MCSCKVLAVIPARGGSKRIPKKNIKEFCGKPMISWAINVLKDSNFINEIIVSTDSEEVLSVVQNLGVKTPFIRPSKLADDFTGTAAVTKHAVKWYLDNIGSVDYVLTVYPTAVFLSNKDIEDAFNILQSTDREIVFSGTEYSFPIQRAVYLDDKKRVTMFQPKHYSSRSQDLLKAYHDAGQFYFAKLSAVLNDVSAFSKASQMLVLPRYQVVDIDTMDDFKVAERLFKISRDL